MKKFLIISALAFFSMGMLIFIYVLLGNVGAVTGQISIAEAADRWRVAPIFILCFISGMACVIILCITSIHTLSRSGYRQGYKSSRPTYYQNAGGSQRYNRTGSGRFNNNSNFKDHTMDDLTREQYEQFKNEMNFEQQQQFMNEMNMQQQRQQQQFMDEMNREQQQFMNDMNMQQQQQQQTIDEANMENERFGNEVNMEQDQQFMDWSTDQTMKSGIPFEDGGYNMDQGNSFNDMNMGF